MIFSSGIINPLLLLIARIFPRPYGARKNTTQLAKYPRVLYVKPSNKMYYSLYFILFLKKDDNPRFAEYFHDHMKDTAAEFFTLLVFCYRDGFEGVEQVVRNRTVS